MGGGALPKPNGAGVLPAAGLAANRPGHYQEFFRSANVLRPGWPLRFWQSALKRYTRMESFSCQPGTVVIRRNSESPESLATRFQIPRQF
jgi:hypothetical protein